MTPPPSPTRTNQTQSPIRTRNQTSQSGKNSNVNATGTQGNPMNPSGSQNDNATGNQELPTVPRLKSTSERIKEAEKNIATANWKPTKTQYNDLLILCKTVYEKLLTYADSYESAQQELQWYASFESMTKKTIEDIEDRLEAKLSAKFEDLLNKNTCSHQPLEPVQRPPKTLKPPTFAQIAANRPKPKPAPPQQQEAPLILSPLPNTTANVVDLVNDDLDFGFTRVNRVRKTKNGNLLVIAGSTTDKETLKERLLSSNISSKYTIRDPKKRSPRLLISDISPIFVNDSDLIKAMHSQNNHINTKMSFADFTAQLKVVFHPRPDRFGNKSVVVEVSPALRTTMLSAPLYTKWQVLQVADYILVTRCFRCQGLGHKTTQCKQQHSTCSHCACEGHGFNECPSKNEATTAKCTNCIRHNSSPGARQVETNHSALSSNCPELRRYKETIFNSTNYGF